MANPDLITALQNAIDRGESLEEAVTILINSGYNTKEVQEASHYIGRGVLSSAKPRQGEELTMLSQKNSFKSLKPWNQNNEPQQNQPANIPAQSQNMQNSQYNPAQGRQPSPQVQNNPSPQQTQGNVPAQLVNPGNVQKSQPYPMQKINEAPQSDSQIFMKNLGLSDSQGPTKNNQQMIINQSNASESTGMPKEESIPKINVPNLYPPQANNTKIYKKSYTKEIILLVVLLLLIGLLATTIIFKDTIISWFG
jgi:hypothetical protein